MSLEAVLGGLPYLVAVFLFLVGLYGIVTSRNLVHLVVCVGVLQSSTYVVLLAIGYKRGGAAPVFLDTPPDMVAVDPVVQALSLTDVVVEATVIALLLALVARVHRRAGTLNPDEIGVLRG